MALTNVQSARVPLANDIAVYNYGVTDIPAGIAVQVDATNTMNNSASAPKTLLGVIPATEGGNPSLCIGITLTVVPASGQGIVAGPGQIAPIVCDGAVTAGGAIDASPTAGKGGYAKAHVAAKNSLGIALATGADGDTIQALVAPAVNA